MFTSRLSLHVRIMGIAVAMLVILLATLYFGYYVAIEDEAFEARISWKTLYVGRIVSVVMQGFLVTRDYETAKSALADILVRDEEIASLRVNLDRDTFYLVSRREALDPQRYFERSHECLDQKGRVVGAAVVGFWKRGQWGASNISILNTVIAVDLVVLVGLFLHLLLRELVTRPLENLVEATKRVASGDLTEMVPVSEGSVEAERLSSSFNEMIVRLRESREALSRMNAELEERVVARTEELRRANLSSQTIIASIADGLYTVDAGKRIVVFNPAAEKLTGLKAADVIGKPCADVLRYPFCKTDCLLERLCRSSERGAHRPPEEYFEEFEVEGRTWLVAGANFDDRAGFSGGVETIKDLSYSRRLQQRIRQVERLTSLGALSAGVAHEINNPLSNIRIMAQLVQEDVGARRSAEEEALVANVKNIVEQTDRASAIVRKMLEFSRQSQVVAESVDVARTLEQSVEMVRYMLQNEGVEVRMEIAEGLPAIEGNRLGLQQVFINLFNNARQAMRAGGGGVLTVRASVEREPHRIVVSVADTGAGVRREDLGRIFEPFFTTKDVGEGTGLGLSISYGIIKEHRGDIAVESEPGRGTVFTITLPVA